MAVIQTPYTRGGKTKNLELGIDAEGNSHYKAETVLPEGLNDLIVREAPVKIVIELDNNQLTGDLVRITTTVGKGYVSPNGKVIEDTIKRVSFLSAGQDLKDFNMMYGNGILRSVANGIVEILDGYKGKKVFNPQTGAVLTYTEAEENEPVPAPEQP
jgi:hypothetical protein